MYMLPADLILGQAFKTCPTSGQSTASLWPLFYMFWATVEVFWQGGSTLGTHGCIITFLSMHTYIFLYIYTHALVFQRDISWISQQEDGGTAWTSGSGTTPSLGHWHLLLQGVTPSPTFNLCVLFLSTSCWAALPPSFWVATTQSAKHHFLFIYLL